MLNKDTKGIKETIRFLREAKETQFGFGSKVLHFLQLSRRLSRIGKEYLMTHLLLELNVEIEMKLFWD